WHARPLVGRNDVERSAHLLLRRDGHLPGGSRHARRKRIEVVRIHRRTSRNDVQIIGCSPTGGAARRSAAAAATAAASGTTTAATATPTPLIADAEAHSIRAVDGEVVDDAVGDRTRLIREFRSEQRPDDFVP